MNSHFSARTSLLSKSVSQAAQEMRLSELSSNPTKKLVLAASGVAILSSSLMSAPVFAQEDALEEIVITGSRIRRNDFDANSPTVTVDSDTFEQTSTIGLDTILNQLPQFIPGAITEAGFGGDSTTSAGAIGVGQPGGGQFASGALGPNSFSTPGSSSVNLRGLGAGRNLVLIDGRRGMPINASMTIDLNSIPSSALERVEVVSGGASAVYGADAVAGAVNFILKDNFEGAEISTRYGISELGDAEEFTINGLFGATTADGRGSVMLGLEHSHRGEGNYFKRDWYQEDRANPNTGGTAFFADGVYICGFLSFDNCVNGADPAGQQAVIDSIFPEAAAAGTPVAPNSHFFVNRKSQTIYTGFYGNRNGGYRYEGFEGGKTVEYRGDLPFRTINEFGQIKENEIERDYISVPLDRYSLFGRGKYDLTDSMTAFANVMFSRSKTVTKNGPPEAAGVWNVRVPHGTGIYTGSLTNPNDPGSATLPAFLPGGPMGLNCPAVGGCTNSDAWPVPTEVGMILGSRSNPNAPFTINHVAEYLGPRILSTTTSNYQFQFGLEGELDNGYYWDVAMSWGESESLSDMKGYGSLDRFRDVLSSPNYGRLFTQQGNQDNFGLFGGTGTCTTGLPIFEDFVPSSDCLSTVTAAATQTGLMEQTTFDAGIGGDLFEIAAGPVQFAAGVSWRHNQYSFKTSDTFNSYNYNNLLMGQAPVNPTFGEIKSREIFGEVLIPIVADGPMGMRELNVELGGRYSDYYQTSGGVETYKALADWLIADWVRFRGGYQLATRAPNIRELFLGRTQAPFASGSPDGDLCSLNNGDSSLSAAQGVTDEGQALATAEQAAFTRSICEDLMGSTGAAAYYGRPINEMPEGGGSGNIYVSGNPTVTPETADTFTAGVVMTSPFDNVWLEGMNLTIDWFNIEVTDMIAPDVGAVVINRCFDQSVNTSSPPSSNFYCGLIKRNPGNGEPYEFDLAYSNAATANLSGIDIQLSWNASLSDLGVGFIPGGIAMNVLATIPLEVETQAAADAEVIDWVGYQQNASCVNGVSCTTYDYTMFSTFSWFNGPWSANLRWQRFPTIDHGNLATNPDSNSRGIFDSYDLFALSGTYRFNDSLTLMAGIENLFDAEPPMGGGNPLADPIQDPVHVSAGIYDPIGRRFYISAKVTF